MASKWKGLQEEEVRGFGGQGYTRVVSPQPDRASRISLCLLEAPPDRRHLSAVE